MLRFQGFFGEVGVFLLDVNNPTLFIYDYVSEGGSKKTWFVAGDYVVLEESVYDPLESSVRVRRVFYRPGMVENMLVRGVSRYEFILFPI